jgi:hypothetical protein
MALAEADFIGSEFSTKTATSKTLVRWVKPDEVVVSVQLPGRGAQSAALRARKWVGEPANAVAVQRRLGNFGDLNLGGLADFTLYLKRGGRKVATLNWAAVNETKELAELRGMLDGVAHLPCAEAMAYWDEGHTLTQHKLYAKASQTLATGLRILGERYRGPTLRDDTGTHLVMAEHHEKAGQADAACRLFDRVLKSRIAAYQALRGLEDLG